MFTKSMFRKKVLIRSASKAVGYVFCLALLSVAHVQGMADNRFLVPFLEHHPFLTDRECSAFSVQPFMLTANNAYNEYGKSTNVGLFDYGVPYRLREVDKSLVAAGIVPSSVIRSDMTGFLTVGPYLMEGRLDGQGVTWNGYMPFNDFWAIGGRWAFMHINTRLEMLRDVNFDSVIVGPGDERDVFLIKERINQLLGLDPGLWDAYGPGDLELYARLFFTQDYAYRCRYFDLGASLGLIVPAGVPRDINNPASIPFGGDRHWGIFLEGTLDAILKQDIRAGFTLRVQKRFSRIAEHRVPVGDEPPMFGAVVGEMDVDPGFTFLFSPYVMFEALRGGFGIFAGYTLAKHWCDTWTDCRADKTVPVNLACVETYSGWGLEHASFGLFYDFSEGRHEHAVIPVVTFNVNVPIDLLVSRRAMKTYGISLIIEAGY